jgi:hypothetical protein
MRPILKIGFALAIFLAALLFMGMRAEHTSVSAELENEACSSITIQGPHGIATAGVVVTDGPASALLEIGDYLRRHWRHLTGKPPEQEDCWWLPQGPSKF